MTVVSKSAGFRTRRGGAPALFTIAAVTAAVLFAISERVEFPGPFRGLLARMTGAVAHTTQAGADRLMTVAEMLAGRSPGERKEGDLVSLKPGHRGLPRERALPKDRRSAPVAPLAKTVGPMEAPAPLLPVDVTPVFSAVTSAPIDGVEVAAAQPTRFTELPVGGVPVVPPALTEGSPGMPVSAVPEPATWFLMLAGFAAIGLRFRQSDRLALACPAKDCRS